MSVTSRMSGHGRGGCVLAVVASTLALGGLLAASAAQASAAPRPTSAPEAAAQAQAARAEGTVAGSARFRRACPPVRSGYMRCFVLVRPQSAVNRALAAGGPAVPQGWGPRALERAYRLPVNRRSHQTVAVSIAFRTPHLAEYLRTYRKHFGLPPCGLPSGCLRIVNQNGKSSPLAPSGAGSGWDLEATLDVSMISVACPHCKILVVEANSNSDTDLAQTDNTAARLGADVISNSYGTRENGYSMTLATAYQHPGHMVVASSGDFGFDSANFPANLATVTAVGGTSLARAHDKRGFTERVWNDPQIFGAGGSGCSAYVNKPFWQNSPHCPGRTVADISAIAENIPIFNAFYGGWLTVAGTSVSAPFIAGVYGLAGNARSVTTRDLYRHPADFFDIIRGNNALTSSSSAACGNDYLCVAKKGYDAPTGLGTPDGIAGF